MKNKFKDTKVGNIANLLLKGVVKKIPIVGDLAENVHSEDAGKGNLDIQKLVSQIIRLVMFGVLVWQFAKGNIPLTQLIGF